MGHCTNKLLETSSAVCTAKLFPLVETASPPRLDLSPGGPARGQLTPMPFSGVERPLRASVPPIPL